jgi:cell division protein FtsX
MLNIVFKNLKFYWQKIALTVALVSFLLFLALASILFTQKIKTLADAPLDSLQTEIILQKDKVNKSADTIKTTGAIEPFNLASFSKNDTKNKLNAQKEIKEISTALILWQFDIQNNRTIVGLDINEPQVGLRKIQQWLMPKSQFFTSNTAKEVILERHFAKLFGYKLHSNYKINTQDYKIIGIVDFKEESNLSNAQVFMPYDSSLQLVGKDTQIVNQVYISLAEASQLSKVQEDIENNLPNFSVLTKDRLLKNLSSFNRIMYQFGTSFTLTISSLVLFLIFWILKMNRMEFRNQTDILKMIGWSKVEIRKWVTLELSLTIALAASIALVLLLVFALWILPEINTGILLNQNFTL